MLKLCCCDIIHFIDCIIIISTLHLLCYLHVQIFYNADMNYGNSHFAILNTVAFVQIFGSYYQEPFLSSPRPISCWPERTYGFIRKWIDRKHNTKLLNIGFPFTLMSNPRKIQNVNVCGWTVAETLVHERSLVSNESEFEPWSRNLKDI